MATTLGYLVGLAAYATLVIGVFAYGARAAELASVTSVVHPRGQGQQHSSAGFRLYGQTRAFKADDRRARRFTCGDGVKPCAGREVDRARGRREVKGVPT
jgi:hypothetical protein